MSILTIIFTKATKTVTKNITYTPRPLHDWRRHQRPRWYEENLSRVRRRVTRLSKLPWEESTFNTHFLTKRDKLAWGTKRWLGVFDGLVTRLAWPTFLHANTLTRPGLERSTGPTPDNHSEHALAPYQLLANETADISRRHWWFAREMTSEKQAQKFHTDDASFPWSGWCFWLVGSLLHRSNQKHYPDLSSDASSVWISALVSQTSCRGKITCGVAKCRLFPQANFFLT